MPRKAKPSANGTDQNRIMTVNELMGTINVSQVIPGIDPDYGLEKSHDEYVADYNEFLETHPEIENPEPPTMTGVSFVAIEGKEPYFVDHDKWNKEPDKVIRMRLQPPEIGIWRDLSDNGETTIVITWKHNVEGVYFIAKDSLTVSTLGTNKAVLQAYGKVVFARNKPFKKVMTISVPDTSEVRPLNMSEWCSMLFPVFLNLGIAPKPAEKQLPLLPATGDNVQS